MRHKSAQALCMKHSWLFVLHSTLYSHTVYICTAEVLACPHLLQPDGRRQAGWPCAHYAHVVFHRLPRLC